MNQILIGMFGMSLLVVAWVGVQQLHQRVMGTAPDSPEKAGDCGACATVSSCQSSPTLPDTTCSTHRLPSIGMESHD